MSEKQTQYGGGMGLSGGLFLLFLGLQLTGHIDWPWYAIAAPLWAPLVLVLAIMLVVVVIAFPVMLIRERRRVDSLRTVAR